MRTLFADFLTAWSPWGPDFNLVVSSFLQEGMLAVIVIQIDSIPFSSKAFLSLVSTKSVSGLPYSNECWRWL